MFCSRLGIAFLNIYNLLYSKHYAGCVVHIHRFLSHYNRRLLTLRSNLRLAQHHHAQIIPRSLGLRQHFASKLMSKYGAHLSTEVLQSDVRFRGNLESDFAVDEGGIRDQLMVMKC